MVWAVASAGFFSSAGCRSYPRTPFSASGALPPLRSGQVSLDEAEHFLHNRSASVVTLRWCSGSSRNAVRMHPGFSVRLRRNPHHPPGTVRDDPTDPSGSRQVPSASASETCPRAAQLHVGLLEAPQAVSGRAVEYFTCFMEIFDFTFPTPAILANRFTQNSRNSSRSRATTRST
jgi:hypothetical protein